jgi:putative oxidoreductase
LQTENANIDHLIVKMQSLNCPCFPVRLNVSPELTFNRRSNMKQVEQLGVTLLRVSLGVVFLVHSAYLKVVVFTVPGTVGYFESIGLPAIVAYGTIAAEVVGGVLLILGVGVRPVAAVLTAVALGATWAHLGAGWLFTNEGGGYEFPLFLTVATAAQFLLGPGALRLQVPQLQQAPAWAQ